MNNFSNDIEGKILVTGVGSLPYGQTQDAVDFVCKALAHHVPFWPQLPRRSFYENMYVQFCEKFPGIIIDESAKTVSINTARSSYISELEECFNKTQSLENIDYFAISRLYAEGLYSLKEKLKVLN